MKARLIGSAVVLAVVAAMYFVSLSGSTDSPQDQPIAPVTSDSDFKNLKIN